MSQTTTVNGQNFYYMDFPGEENISIIFNGSGGQTADITGITESVYYEYDGGSNATKLNITPGPSKPVVTASPASGTKFTESIKVTLTVSPSVAIHYTLDGTQPSASSPTYNAPLTFTQTTTLKTFVENEVGSNVQTFVYTKSDTPIPSGYTVYFQDSSVTWNPVNCYVWSTSPHMEHLGSWPGKAMTATTINGMPGWMITIDSDTAPENVIFNGNGGQTKDLTFTPNGLYNMGGFVSEISSSDDMFADMNGNKLDIRVIGGQLVIYSEQQTTIGITSLTGQRHTINLYPGVNTIETLDNGFYVVEGQKVMLNR